MKKLLLLLGIIALMGCSIPGQYDVLNSSAPAPNARSDDDKKIESEMAIVIIDDCEYLKYPVTLAYSGPSSVPLYYTAYFYMHKGNCSNPIHKYYPELRK